MPVPAPFVTDPVLTAIAVNYINPDVNFIADDVLPRVPVMSEDFKWTFYPSEEIFTLPDTLVGRKGRVPEVELTGEERTSSVEDHGLDSPVPQKDIDRARDLRAQGRTAFDPEARATEALTHLIRLGREKRVADLVQDAAQYDADKKVTLAGTSQWTDQVNSTPVDDISAALDATFILRPNIAVMGRTAWTALSTHPHIVKAVNRNDGDKGRAARQAVAELFELQDVLVGDTYLNTAKKGQSAVMSRVWGGSVALLHRNRQAGQDGMIGFGWTAVYDGMVSGRIVEPKMGLKGGVTIRTGEQVKEIISAPATGYLIENAA